MPETVKVQITTDGEAAIYDRAEKHRVVRPLLPHEQKLMGSDTKAYMRGAWSSVVGWGISARVPDEER